MSQGWIPCGFELAGERTRADDGELVGSTGGADADVTGDSQSSADIKCAGDRGRADDFKGDFGRGGVDADSVIGGIDLKDIGVDREVIA